MGASGPSMPLAAHRFVAHSLSWPFRNQAFAGKPLPRRRAKTVIGPRFRRTHWRFSVFTSCCFHLGAHAQPLVKTLRLNCKTKDRPRRTTAGGNGGGAAEEQKKRAA